MELLGKIDLGYIPADINIQPVNKKGSYKPPFLICFIFIIYECSPSSSSSGARGTVWGTKSCSLPGLL